LYPSFQEWNKVPKDPQRVFYFTTKTQKSFYDVEYQIGDYFVFGKETKGLGSEILSKVDSQAVTIPFPGKIRSFNLSNAVSMVLGEGLRQLRYNKSR
jgi:tRNA (cytidine/uridine-2'-O-)-methyltransferase